MLLTLRYMLASRLHFAHFSFDFCLNSSIAFMGFCSYFLALVTCAFARLVIDSLNSSSLDSLYTLAQILARFSLNFSLTSCSAFCLLLAWLFLCSLSNSLLASPLASCVRYELGSCSMLIQFFARFFTRLHGFLFHSFFLSFFFYFFPFPTYLQVIRHYMIMWIFTKRKPRVDKRFCGGLRRIESSNFHV